MKTVQKKRVAFLCSLLVILLVPAGCDSLEATPPTLEENPCANIERAVDDWIDDSVDELSEEIGSLATGGLPLAKDIVAIATEAALLAWVEFSVEDAEPIQGTDRCSARVKLEFPLELEIPLLGKIGYRVSIAYDITVEDGEVTDSDINLSSFEMTESSE